MKRYWILLVLVASLFCPSAVAEESYGKRLVEHLNKSKRYPASAAARHASGETIVAFTVDGEGKVTESSIVRSSGEADLDQASLEMLVRAQPLPKFPEKSTSPQRFSLPVIFRMKSATELLNSNIDLSALMMGKCKTLKVEGRDLNCKSISYFHTKDDRENFTITLDDLEDDAHTVSFSGQGGRQISDDAFELPIDRMLLNSKDRPKIGGLPTPQVEASAGICKQAGNLSAKRISSVSCTAMDRSGRQYELTFELDGSPIVVRDQRLAQVGQSPPTDSQRSATSRATVLLPPVIQAATIQEMADCGAKEIPEAAITNLDLNGDGANDYIVNFEKIFENVAGCSCGSAGCNYVFWVSEKGSFVRSFSEKIQGIERIENGPTGQAVILGRHGSTCDQVGSNACYFRLTWERSKAKLEPLNTPSQSQSRLNSGSTASETLVKRWQTANGSCRGDTYSINTELACEERAKLGAQLVRLGWCYGKKGQIGAQMMWHECTSTSLTGAEKPSNLLALAGRALSIGAWVFIDPHFPGQEKQGCAAFRKFGLAKLSGNSVGELIYIDSKKRLNFGGYADDEWQHQSVVVNRDGSFTFRDKWYDDGEGGSRAGQKIKTYTVRQISSDKIEVVEGKYSPVKYMLCMPS